MILTELISTSVVNDKFHTFAEQITGHNTASVVQKGRRPRSVLAYPLAYFKAFSDNESDTSDVRALLGMMHIGMLSAGPGYEVEEVTGWPSGLRFLAGPTLRSGIASIIITGDGEQWFSTINNAGKGGPYVKQWGLSCYQQFTKNNLDDLFGTMRKDPREEGGYFLEYN